MEIVRGEDLKQLAGDRDPPGGGHHQEAVPVIPGHSLQHLLTQLGQFDRLETHVDRNLKKLRCRFVFMLNQINGSIKICARIAVKFGFNVVCCLESNNI